MVPIFNDADLSEEFCAQFERTFEEYLGTSEIVSAVELIFVNDGSEVPAEDALAQLPARFRFARIINLSRNFGQHVALACGYRHARGRYVGSLNVDMQEHPNQIPRLLRELESGNSDIVFGLRSARAGSVWDSLTSALFNLILNKITGHPVPLNISTIRVMNRRFVAAYNSLTESSRYMPGLESWLGFRRGYVEIEHRDRQHGRSSYNFTRRLLMASDAIVGFSDLPLRVAVVIGFWLVGTSVFLSILLVIKKLFFATMPLGYTSIVCIYVMCFGLQISIIGLASLYIGRILREVQHRPLYVIRSLVNADPE